MQKGIITLKNRVSIASSASVCGKREKAGPLGDYYDFHDDTDKFTMPTWEQSESEMQRLALNFAMSKLKYSEKDIDIILAGDLINQCTSSTFGLITFDIPYIGLFGACSTMSESILLSSLLIDGGHVKRTAAVTSSHNCTAERQFRTPLEYGGQRPPTAQWTVTGAAAVILESGGGGPYVRDVLPGRTLDSGIDDANNMGAAMAPAAIDTLYRYFKESGSTPADFDLIVSGDLGFEGHSIVRDLLGDKGYQMNNYTDCGLLVYDRERQDVHSGGSGCGCSGIVLSGYLLDEMKRGAIKNMLFMATGALMSPLTVQQGQTIPGVAHLIHITKEGP